MNDRWNFKKENNYIMPTIITFLVLGVLALVVRGVI